MKFSGIGFLLLSSVATAQFDVCPSDIRECPDGSSIVREGDDCEFPPCPNGACSLDLAECPDGSVVGREPPNCTFAQCPSGGCTLDVKICPDGSTVSRELPDCEFPPCGALCPLDIFECDDGTVLTRQPPDCEFEDCPTGEPTAEPTPSPTAGTAEPTDSPTMAPTESTGTPTIAPTEGTPPPATSPTMAPTGSTGVPTGSTGVPTASPSAAPTGGGSPEPSASPSATPSSAPSSSPSHHPSYMPSETPSTFPTLSAMPSSSPSAAPSDVPTMAPTAPINCSEYQVLMEVPGLEDVTLEYVVNLNFNESFLMDNTTNITLMDNTTEFLNETIYGTISVRITYQGQGWLGFAVSPYGGMINSSAVIGIPDEEDNLMGMGNASNVSKYFLTFEDGAPGYVELPEEQQTLMDYNITQDEFTTVLEFTRFLEEEEWGEMSINGTGFNLFLVAYGVNNELGYHAGRSPFNVTLEPCIPTITIEDLEDIVGDLLDEVTGEEVGDSSTGSETIDVVAVDKGIDKDEPATLSSSGAATNQGVFAILSVVAGFVFLYA